MSIIHIASFVIAIIIMLTIPIFITILRSMTIIPKGLGLEVLDLQGRIQSLRIQHYVLGL